MSLIGISYANAQSSLIATLSHENDVKVFYGVSALKEAHEAAVAGDVITLSSGTFSATDITKAVTIRGAGVIDDFENGYEKTILKDDFYIRNVTDSIHSLTMEGIYVQDVIYYIGITTNAKFIKCRFARISFYNGSSDKIKSSIFLNCRIIGTLVLYDNSDATLINCIVKECQSYNYYSSNFECINCVIYDVQYIASSLLKNCYLVKNKLSNLNEAYNCVSANDRCFNYMSNLINKYCPASELFKTYAEYEFTDADMFELKDEAKQKYLGTDGTEIGIYGGNYPFDVTSDFPRIVKCDVASKSTIDGKLSVDIQVKTGK